MTTALVPARKGSVRIADKNVRHVGRHALVSRKVRQLRDSEFIDRVVVGTNCETIAALATNEGAEIVWRPDDVCDETLCSANRMIRDFVSRVEGEEDEVLVWAHCTNPFVYGKHYDQALLHYREGVDDLGNDSLMSVLPIQSHAWTKNGARLNFSQYAARHPLASELDPIYFQDGAIFVQTRERFIETSYFYGREPRFFLLDAMHGLDINTPEELQLADLIADFMDAQERFA